MTYLLPLADNREMIFSDTHFKDFRKKPTISIYDANVNCETKIASFNSQETFEWFIDTIVKPYSIDSKESENNESHN